MSDHEIEMLEAVKSIINERDRLKETISLANGVIKRQELQLCNLREELANMRLVLSRECECGGKCK